MAVSRFILQPASLFDTLPAGVPVHYAADTFAELAALGVDGDTAYATDTDLEYTFTGRSGWIAKQAVDFKGVADGYAELDSSTLVPVAQIPALNAINPPTGSVNFADQQALSFRVENRTSDPVSPTVGQIWFRTDL